MTDVLKVTNLAPGTHSRRVELPNSHATLLSFPAATPPVSSDMCPLGLCWFVVNSHFESVLTALLPESHYNTKADCSASASLRHNGSAPQRQQERHRSTQDPQCIRDTLGVGLLLPSRWTFSHDSISENALPLLGQEVTWGVRDGTLELHHFMIKFPTLLSQKSRLWPRS